MKKFWYRILYEWDWYRKIRRLKCLLTGHKVVVQYSIPRDLEDWCEFCWYSESDIHLDETTLPKLLNRLYCWVVEHNLGLFDKFDLWLIDSKYRKYLPSWWEY